MKKISITAARRRDGGKWDTLYAGPSIDEALAAAQKADAKKYAEAAVFRKPAPFKRHLLG